MRRSIGTKIIFTYMVVLVISLGTLGFLFNSMVRAFLVKEVQNSLQKEGAVLVRLLQNVPLSKMKTDVSENRRTFRLVNRLFEGNYFVTDLKGNVVFSNRSAIAETGTRITQIPMERSYGGETVKGVYRLRNKDYVMISLPLTTLANKTRGALVMYTELTGVQKLGTSIIRLLFRVLLMVGLPTIIIGVFLSRSISKPIKLLEKGARRLAERDFATRFDIHTGDELEQLGHTFNTMAIELKNYYVAQKRFLQNASHELKTPLMSIQGFAEGIRDGILEGEEKDKGLEIIIDESNRLKNLVNELIYLSKLETLEEVYDFQENDVAAILRESVAKVENIAAQNGVKIFVNELNFLGQVKVDREKISRAFINLLSNAIRFAGSRVEVVLSRDSEDMIIQFNDDGLGFKNDELDKVFDRFYVGQKGDTGLGLAITKAIVEKHGGKIAAQNTDSGASITVILPVSVDV